MVQSKRVGEELGPSFGLGRIENVGEINNNDNWLSYFSMENVEFRSDSSRILEESFPALDNLVTFLKKHPDLKIEVSGYTDSTGDSALNLTLSQKRAESVKEYLVNHGIDGNRVVAKGYGSSNPIGDNSLSNGRRKIEG